MEGEKINMSRIPLFILSLEWKRCSQCGKLHSASSMYFNKEKRNLWCTHCLGKVKKERNPRWDKKLGRKSKKGAEENEK